jgi:cellulose biosynthesis protein BcsQ
MHLFPNRIMIGQLQFLLVLPQVGAMAKRALLPMKQFISQLRKIGRAHKHDFIVIDTPGGVQHLSLIVHGMADTLITPINDSLVDLDVLVVMEQSDLEPQPSVYAKMVWRALEARRSHWSHYRLDRGSEPIGISRVKQISIRSLRSWT